MAADYLSVREKIFERYPFFRSSYFERRMLFERRDKPPVPVPNVSRLSVSRFSPIRFSPIRS
jgi:hypothetical protein